MDKMAYDGAERPPLAARSHLKPALAVTVELNRIAAVGSSAFLGDLVNDAKSNR
jgi:hypothetical protein